MTSPVVKPVHMDRLPLPVVISFIRSRVQEGEIIRIGNKVFSKVMCIGRVVSSRPIRTLASTEYIVADPSEKPATLREISVLHRNESPAKESEKPEQFPPGTSVFISGKLTRFKGAVAIQANCMRELICPDEFECMKMEAFLALQFHTKNPALPTPIRRAQGSPLPNSARSFSPFTPPSSAGGKRLSSSTSSFTPTSKRANIVSGSVAVIGGNAEKSNLMKAGPQTCIQTKADTAEEAGSQDSFEDAVFFEK
ncbi:hypothetical protein Y032_0130g1568 [Ancylostoma ceylanicum]|uniref:Uncharacterized protein n=1 Tax=Ancylostoma ceylanicum TaxID=53326 RepID=A0A016T7H4_9BILA|nr:hypothetical protein Y032_0130g1568 [Ancylostoma ceylanicum]